MQTAFDGVSGRQSCRTFEPDIVITDIRMPRMDGLQILERIKTHSPDIEVVVATAFAEMAMAVKALRLDASDFITKPIDHDALMVALDRAKQRVNTRKRLEEYTRFLENCWTH